MSPKLKLKAKRHPVDRWIWFNLEKLQDPNNEDVKAYVGDEVTNLKAVDCGVDTLAGKIQEVSLRAQTELGRWKRNNLGSQMTSLFCDRRRTLKSKGACNLEAVFKDEAVNRDIRYNWRQLRRTGSTTIADHRRVTAKMPTSYWMTSPRPEFSHWRQRSPSSNCSESSAVQKRWTIQLPLSKEWTEKRHTFIKDGKKDNYITAGQAWYRRRYTTSRITSCIQLMHEYSWTTFNCRTLIEKRLQHSGISSTALLTLKRHLTESGTRVCAHYADIQHQRESR